MLKPEVRLAIDQLRRCFPEAAVDVSDSGDGGAVVTIDPVELGPAYVERDTWIKFAISFQYPYADVYPLFVRPDLTRSDGRGHGPGIALNPFQGEPATQLSRRSNHLDPRTDTVALKVTKVLKWLREQ